MNHFKKARLIRLRTMFAYEIAQSKQARDGLNDFMGDEENELSILSLMWISQRVVDALIEDSEFRDGIRDRVEAISCVMSTAALGIAVLKEENRPLAEALVHSIKKELDLMLEGDLDDYGKN